MKRKRRKEMRILAISIVSSYIVSQLTSMAHYDPNIFIFIIIFIYINI